MPSSVARPLTQFQDIAGYFAQTPEGYDVGAAATAAALGFGFGQGFNAVPPAPNSTIGNVFYGANNGTPAQPGQVGEQINAIQSVQTNFVTTATYQQLLTANVTPGDWEAQIVITFNANSATLTATANSIFALSTTTASQTGAIEGQSILYGSQNLSATGKETITATFPVTVTGSVAVPYFLNGQATFTGGNPQYVASLTFRRMR